jgi:hypothetical protein
MIPDGTPVASRSASWHARATSVASSVSAPASQSASATATSNAALDDSPDPAGTLDSISA